MTWAIPTCWALAYPVIIHVLLSLSHHQNPTAIIQPPVITREGNSEASSAPCAVQGAQSCDGEQSTKCIITASDTSDCEDKGSSVENGQKEEKLRGKFERETKEQAREHKSIHVVESEDWMGGKDDEFLKEVIHELEQFEKENYPEQCETEHTTKQCQESCSIVAQPNKQDVFPQCIQTHCPHPHLVGRSGRSQVTVNDTTPSRTPCIPHIVPVTLLPPSHGCVQMYGSNKDTFQKPKTPLSTAQVLSPPPNLTYDHTKSSAFECSTLSHSKPINQEAPPEATAGATSLPKPACDDGFRTPSTSQWMKTKNSFSSSSLSGQDSPVPFNGGKITPPLCDCGKRTRRKVVSSPGPNQGKPFYSCSKGRTSGCGYFKWEISQHSFSSFNLSSEYSCSC